MTCRQGASPAYSLRLHLTRCRVTASDGAASHSVGLASPLPSTSAPTSTAGFASLHEIPPITAYHQRHAPPSSTSTSGVLAARAGHLDRRQTQSLVEAPRLQAAHQNRRSQQAVPTTSNSFLPVPHSTRISVPPPIVGQAFATVPMATLYIYVLPFCVSAGYCLASPTHRFI